MSSPGVLVFDGDCGFCERSVDRLARVSRTAAGRVPWQQADLSALSLTEEQCHHAVQWVGGRGRSSGAQALADFAASGRPGARRAARLVVNPVTRPVADALYRAVARNRYRLGSATCGTAPGPG